MLLTNLDCFVGVECVGADERDGYHSQVCRYLCAWPRPLWQHVDRHDVKVTWGTSTKKYDQSGWKTALIRGSFWFDGSDFRFVNKDFSSEDLKTFSSRLSGSDWTERRCLQALICCLSETTGLTAADRHWSGLWSAVLRSLVWSPSWLSSTTDDSLLG